MKKIIYKTALSTLVILVLLLGTAQRYGVNYEKGIKIDNNTVITENVQSKEWDNKDKSVFEVAPEDKKNISEQPEATKGTEVFVEYKPEIKPQASEKPLKDTAVMRLSQNSKEKVAYLTFDDGPSKKITPQILEILDKYNIKATFFVVGSMAEKNPDILKSIYSKGHYIGNHSYSHKYKEIYASPEAFIKDLKKAEVVFKSILGQEHNTDIVRFPGGSFGEKLLPIRMSLAPEGYRYIDWNAISGDASGKDFSKEELFDNVKETVGNKNKVVLLMHDGIGKDNTVEILPEVIEYLISKGYTFKTIENYK